MMHGNLTTIGAELVAKKADSNGGGAGGAAPFILSRRLGLPSQVFYVGWQGERLPTKTTT